MFELHSKVIRLKNMHIALYNQITRNVTNKEFFDFVKLKLTNGLSFFRFKSVAVLPIPTSDYTE